MSQQNISTSSATGLPDTTGMRVDIHCHCLPGIDDGPSTLEDALALCRLLVADGINTVIATPHQLGRYGRANTAGRIHECVEKFRGDLAANDIPLRILPGAEVRIDERIQSGVESGELLTLAGSRLHLLLELPKHTFIDPLPIIENFSSRGDQVIVAHPERQHGVMQSPEIAGRWVQSGAILQVTAGSLLGDFGIESERAAWTLLSKDWVHLIATDAHNAHKRPPRMSAAMHEITQRLGEGVSTRICIDNPARVARGLRLAAADLKSNHSPSGPVKRAPVSSLQAWAMEMEQHKPHRSPAGGSPLTALCRWFAGAARDAAGRPSKAISARRPQTLE